MSGNLTLSFGLPCCLVMFWLVGLRQLLIYAAHKALSVKWDVIQQSAALLCGATSLQVLEDEQTQAGFERSGSCCNGTLAVLHLAAQTFSAWKSNSLSRTSLCFIIGFPDPAQNWNIYCVENDTFACVQNDGWQKIKPWDGRKLRSFVDTMIALSQTESSCRAAEYLSSPNFFPQARLVSFLD